MGLLESATLVKAEPSLLLFNLLLKNKKQYDYYTLIKSKRKDQFH